MHWQSESLPPVASPRLPIEVCERIIDFVAGSRYIQILPCSLVCRAWLPRCRFHLSPEEVDLRSRTDLASFSLFLPVFPLGASKLKRMNIHGRKEGDTSADDSWVFAVPAMLPPLPNLQALYLYDVDLAHQHLALYKLYSAFTLANPELFLERVSFHHFSQVSRFVLATRAKELHIMDCPITPPMYGLLPCNVFLEDIFIRCTSWTELCAVPSAWFLSCPNIREMTFLHSDMAVLTPSDPLTSRQAHAWSRFCDLFRRLCSRSVQPWKGITINFNLDDLLIVMCGGIAGEHPSLCLRAYYGSRKAAPFVSRVLRAIPLLSPFPTVVIDVYGIDRIWENHTPETWKPVDDALSHYFPFLTHFYLRLPDKISFHDVFTPQYGCIDNLTHALFPRTAQRGIIESNCNYGDCGIHEAARGRQQVLEEAQLQKERIE